MKSTVSLSLTRYAENRFVKVQDEVAAEEPLEIRVEGEPLAVVMRTPGEDRELAAGFLFTEGIIKGVADLFDITSCVPSDDTGRGNAVDVALRDPSIFQAEKHARHGFASASCGICGKVSIAAVLARSAPVQSAVKVSAEMLLALPKRLAEHQAAFQRTGSLHACALFDLNGELIQVREDIGRHNALDKLIGWALLAGFAGLQDAVVFLSGRTSFEMMQKAQAAGIPIVAAISGPSSLAVNLALESGQTLVGFVRGGTMNVYAGSERIVR